MRKLRWFFIFAAAFAVLTLIIYINVIKAGEPLSSSPFLQYGYYALCGALYILLVIRPIAGILFMPEYSASEILNCKRGRAFYIKLCKNLLKRGELEPEISRRLLLMQSSDEDLHVICRSLYQIYNGAVKSNIEKIIKDRAKSTFYITALSQNGFIDMLTVLINSFSMIKKIVSVCGFRPSLLKTFKLYINIFFSSLIAEGAQSINLSGILGGALSSGLKKIFNCVSNGAVNAFFMLRSGLLAKEYIFCADLKRQKVQLKQTAFAQAGAMLPQILVSVITDPIKKISKRIFKGRKKEQKNVVLKKVNKNNNYISN